MQKLQHVDYKAIGLIGFVKFEQPADTWKTDVFFPSIKSKLPQFLGYKAQNFFKENLPVQLKSVPCDVSC